MADVFECLVDNDEEKLQKKIAVAELAIHNGINDAVDSLVTFFKLATKRIESDYKYSIATSFYGELYIEALESLQVVDEFIVESRGDRDERLNIYCNLANDENIVHLNKIAKFALKLITIEAGARRQHEGSIFNEDFIESKIIDALQYKPGSYFKVVYQPKYIKHADNSNICVGAEALLRLVIEKDNINPNIFIPIAESTGLINKLGRFVLDDVIDTLQSHPNIPCISINVSPLELLDTEFSKIIIDRLSKEKIDPSRLELELTENMVIDDESSLFHIRSLSELGLRIAVDDFGTGLTRFDYLTSFKVDTIKIDISLVRNLRVSPQSYGTLLSAINAVGNTCNISVIAEGVEDENRY